MVLADLGRSINAAIQKMSNSTVIGAYKPAAGGLPVFAAAVHASGRAAYFHMRIAF